MFANTLDLVKRFCFQCGQKLARQLNIFDTPCDRCHRVDSNIFRAACGVYACENHECKKVRPGLTRLVWCVNCALGPVVKMDGTFIPEKEVVRVLMTGGWDCVNRPLQKEEQELNPQAGQVLPGATVALCNSAKCQETQLEFEHDLCSNSRHEHFEPTTLPSRGELLWRTPRVIECPMCDTSLVCNEGDVVTVTCDAIFYHIALFSFGANVSPCENVDEEGRPQCLGHDRVYIGAPRHDGRRRPRIEEQAALPTTVVKEEAKNDDGEEQ